MRVDSDRQWFVYFKETEMGPYAEPEMLKKLKSGEFDGTAFVFTDGMSDWELIKDTRLQQLLAPAQEEKIPDGLVKEKISAGPSLVDASSRFESAAREPEVQRSTAPSNATTQKRRSIGFKPLVAILFFVLVGAGYLLNRDLINSYISGNSEKIVDLSETVNTQSTNPVAAQDTSVNWLELDAFVRIQDPQGPSFRVANKTLAGLRPVLVGALSPMLKMTRLTVAVFPDNERSLYAIPPVWVWDVGVQSGYFSAGPHLNEGGDLLPGRYRVLIASQGKFLGDVGFELGVYPIGDELVSKKAESQKLLGEISAKERTSLKNKIQTLASIQQRSLALEPMAQGRKGKRRSWLEQRTPVVKDLGELRDAQAKVISGPLFFATEQAQLLVVVRSLDAYLDALEYFSYGGPEHVKLKLNSDIGSLKNAANTAWQKLEVATKDIDARQAVEPLRLDAEVIKARVLEESK